LTSALNADAPSFPAVSGQPNSSTKTITVVGNSNGVTASAALSFTTSLSNVSFNPDPGSTGLPVVQITTTGGVPITSRDLYVTGSVTIVPGTQTPGVGYTGTMQIKGHGHSTWGMPKKPYKIKLDSKASLLGMPSNKSWVLLANYDDKTMLRDYIASELSDRLGLPWASHSGYVELYLNGQYQGTYELIEQVKVASSRVNITSMAETDISGDALTGGYLLQIDTRQDEAFIFTTTHGVPFGLEDPDFTPDPEIPQQTSYIQNYVQSAENALYSSTYTDPATGWPAYFDSNALVNFYLVNEIMGNRDGGKFYSSDYVYKDRSNPLLYMGPVWDFDISSGNENEATIENPTVPWMNIRASWYARLFTDPAFKAKVVTQWNSVKQSQLDTLPAFIDQAAAVVAQAQSNNFKRWPILGETVWPNPQALGSYQAEVDYLKTWLNLRIGYLDSQFNGKSATKTTLIVDHASPHFGDPVTLTSAVTNASSVRITSGSVSFLSGALVVGSASLDGTGTATLVTTDLPLGTHAVTAVYNGTSSLGLSASNPTTVNVSQPLSVTAVQLSSSATTAQQGSPVTLAASISAGSGAGAPTGTVTFRSGTTSLGSVPLVNGLATSSFTNLPVGNDSITATYSGDANYQGSTSNSLTITITTSSVCSAPASAGVHVCAPVAGETYSSPVQITATGKGASGTVNHMEVWIDGVKKGQYSGSSVNTALAVAAGTHRVVAVEVDSKGANLKSASVNFTIGTSSGCSAPTSAGVKVCSPVAGNTYSSPVAISAVATGASGSVSRMELWIDSKKISNYTGASINTSVSVAAGSHHATVVEVDSKGAVLKSPQVPFTVK
jgi:hypothetical protein